MLRPKLLIGLKVVASRAANTCMHTHGHFYHSFKLLIVRKGKRLNGENGPIWWGERFKWASVLSHMQSPGRHLRFSWARKAGGWIITRISLHISLVFSIYTKKPWIICIEKKSRLLSVLSIILEKNILSIHELLSKISHPPQKCCGQWITTCILVF